MKSYLVDILSRPREEIASHALYIEQQSRSYEVAERWVRTVYAELRSLDHAPRRHELAEEDKYRDYEIRRLIIGRYLALYTIDDDSDTVRIIGFRDGSRLPKPEDLPHEF